MRLTISSCIRAAARALGCLACFTLLVIMTITIVDVIGRTTSIGRALSGTVEVVELLMGVLVFSGLALTELKYQHIAVDTFQKLFTKPVKKLSRILNLLLATGIVLLLTWQLSIKVFEIYKEQEYTQVLEIPYWPTAIIMSAGLLTFALVLLLRLFEAIFELAQTGNKPVDDR